MDDETSWQDAALTNTDMSLIGPVKPAAAGLPPEHDTVGHRDDDYDELESGIASIFAALHAAGEHGADDTEADDDDGFAEAHTFQLLTELDRLWQRPHPQG